MTEDTDNLVERSRAVFEALVRLRDGMKDPEVRAGLGRCVEVRLIEARRLAGELCDGPVPGKARANAA